MIGGELGGQILQAGRDDHEVAVIKLVISKDPLQPGTRLCQPSPSPSPRFPQMSLSSTRR